ncbi:unnamed protein product [Adineta ricciae]|nr:unnamed protein product [Adineta ricciae]
MATKKSTKFIQDRPNSTDSSASMWEKVSTQFTEGKHDAPFADHASDEDPADEGPIVDNNNQDSEADSDASTSPPIETTSSADRSFKPWESCSNHKHLAIIMNQRKEDEIREDLSKNEFTWRNDEQKLTPFHFGLTALHIDFDQPRLINTELLSCILERKNSWLTFHKQEKNSTERQKGTHESSSLQQLERCRITSNMDIELRYGALVDLTHFQYSGKHSWINQRGVSFMMYLDERRKNGECIEWIVEDCDKRRKKQLLVSNINHMAIIDKNEYGFDAYICQQCNMNEFEAKANNSYGNNNSKQSHNQRARSHSRPRAAPPLCSTTDRSRRINYRPYERVGANAGCYFPTVRFSVHVNQLCINNQNKHSILLQVTHILSCLIKFFLKHQITVCYGQITSNEAPTQLSHSDGLAFPTLITKYAWQLLSSVGYGFQLQIFHHPEFRTRLMQTIDEEPNSDELVYRVCVYLSRIYPLKPFVNIVDELEQGINELKRKQDASAYGLVNKIDVKVDNEAYIPSVTLTPTTIRVKPFKLCRTNRILRAQNEFGLPLYHFVLVDIRDENGRALQAYHFRHLRQILLHYLENGFQLMDDDRIYKYLHHSQSQLRERQFWFYYSHQQADQYRNNGNMSFNEAYRWMGDFTNERNPAKYAARMALCFTTTRGTERVSVENVEYMENDIEVQVNGKKLSFTDGCGKMSKKLYVEIKKHLHLGNDFSAVQFRYAGCKGVVSLDTTLKTGKDLYIRPSMNKFVSRHEIFEVCKLSAPRIAFLNRQAILLLDYRKISPIVFRKLQQENHLQLIRALLINQDAEKLIRSKVPFWFLPPDIYRANIDYIREPFFRQLLISACLQSTRDLLHRTRIRIPPNGGRNMLGIVDEYKVLKEDEVFIQYTILDSPVDSGKNNKKTEILDKRRVVITKNPCHHPGDMRTFTAVDYPELRHLKDVVVFAQQGRRPAPHDISGSDLDGDEYLVVWHEDLVPLQTDNAQPYDYDSPIPVQDLGVPVTREHINRKVLEIAEQDCLGRLSNLHLAFADKFGVDNEQRPPRGIMSTVELAGAISQEVDSGKTGYHPLNEDNIRTLKDSLDNERPDYMENEGFDRYRSKHILGELYRSSKRTLPGWNRLVRYHRHLRHLAVRIHDEEEDENEDKHEETGENDGDVDKESNIQIDESIVSGIVRNHPDFSTRMEFAKNLTLVYRQEMFEILSLYGLSHESDLWCRNSINNMSGELEDTAYTELERLVSRTRTRFHTEQVGYCENAGCNEDTAVSDMCRICSKVHESMTVACYCVCYDNKRSQEEIPILSLPWIFASSLLQYRMNQTSSSPLSSGLLGSAMKTQFDSLFKKRYLRLNSNDVEFRSSDNSTTRAHINASLCIFIEVLQNFMERKKHSQWAMVLSRCVQESRWCKPILGQPLRGDNWKLVLSRQAVSTGDKYAYALLSWNESNDTLMHKHFNDLLGICYKEGSRKNDVDFLKISEDIILLLQQITIKQIISLDS